MDVKRAAGLRILIGLCVYLVALALAFLNTWISIPLYVLVPVAYAMPGKVDLHWRGDRSYPNQQGEQHLHASVLMSDSHSGPAYDSP